MITASAYTLMRGVLFALVFSFFLQGHALGAGQCPADSDTRNQSSQKTLRLYAKNPSTWKIVTGGAKGLLSFDERTGRFTFTAEKLEPSKEYSLVRHNDGETLGDLLVRGQADRAGRLRLTGTWQPWCGKIWLVPSEHTAPSADRLRLTAWRPKQILFEEKVLGVAYPCNTRK